MTSEEERRRQHRHRHKQRVVRSIDDELVNDFDAAAHAAGSDRSNVTRQLWEWFARRPGAQLPERPEPPQGESDNHPK
ncbi:hypothetical protein ACFZAR_36495 [Streptomyces sp. NPDC008222]|uniref:hypothetical protein n=1 Tax=Streptomyces sp. NPDC008222 TaxID=3364820 RepID=UPI0036E4A648